MLNVFTLANGRLVQEEIESLDALAQVLTRTRPVWVDLDAPTADEKGWIAQHFGVSIPADAVDDDPAVVQKRMATVCLLAHRLGARALTVMAGDATLDEAVAQLLPLYEVGARYGVAIGVETVSGTLTGRPKMAAELLARVPGLRLTLDPAHLVVQGQSLADWRHLMTSVAHVHVRDAGPGNIKKLQVDWGTGGVKVADLLRELDAGDYEGWLTVEYVEPGLLPGTVTDAAAQAAKARTGLLEALGATP